MHKFMFQVLKCTIMHDLCISSHSLAKKKQNNNLNDFFHKFCLRKKKLDMHKFVFQVLRCTFMCVSSFFLANFGINFLNNFMFFLLKLCLRKNCDMRKLT